MIKDIINPIIKIKSDIETLNQLREFSEDSLDEGLKSEFESLYKETEKNIKEQETLTYLSGKFDNNASIFEIHAGAGGTESCDWAMMLSRMYTKYFNKKGYTYEWIDEQPGEEAGIKSIKDNVDGNIDTSKIVIRNNDIDSSAPNTYEITYIAYDCKDKETALELLSNNEIRDFLLSVNKKNLPIKNRIFYTLIKTNCKKLSYCFCILRGAIKKVIKGE